MVGGRAVLSVTGSEIHQAATEHDVEPIAARLRQLIAVTRQSRELHDGGHRQAPVVVTLSGELGAGKTVLARCLLRDLGHAGAVKSPTYTLVETYEVPGWRVAHFDLYRLQSPDELEDIGFRDVLDDADLLLVEWPERAACSLPPADWSVVIDYVASGRQVTLTAAADGAACLAIAER